MRLKDGRLYAGSGDAEDCESVRLWLENGGTKPEVKDFVGLVIGADASIWRIENKLVMFQVHARFHAVGSGRDHAMTAMHLGKTAEEAVAIAAVFDVWTGLPVTSVRLSDLTHTPDMV